MTDLIRRDSAGVPAVVDPATGELVEIGTAATDRLAGVADALAELAGKLREADSEVRIELTRRLDAQATWTHRVEYDGRTFEISSSSPTAGATSYPDADGLRAALVHLPDADRPADEAIEGAVPMVRPKPYVKPDLRRLDALHKLGGRVAEVIDSFRVVEPHPDPAERKARVKTVTV